jgi:outer membrane protein insertion porin family
VTKVLAQIDMRGFLRRVGFLLSLTCGLIAISHTPASAIDRPFLRWVSKYPVIDSIHIEGNNSIATSEIRKQMYAKTRSVFQAISASRRSRVQKETINRDTLEIKYLYYLNGYLGVQVRESIEPLPPDSSALIRVLIQEGRQFRYGAKQISGRFPDSMSGNLTTIVNRLETGRLTNPLEIRAVVFEMKSYFANNGHPYAVVTYTLDTLGAGSAAPVSFSVESDSLVHFGSVKIEGSVKFPEYCARRELKIKEGSVYRRDDILNSQRRLFESGYYSTFQLRQSPLSADRLRPDFSLSPTERKTAAITVRTGTGQSSVRDLEWTASAGYLKRNFLGSRRYDVSASYGFGLGKDSRLISHSYRLSFTEPWLLGVRVPLTISTTWDPTLRDPVQDFKRTALSVSAQTSSNFGQTMRATLGFEYVGVKLTELTGLIADSLGGTTSSASRRKLSFAFRRDSRDSIFVPRRGSLTRINIQYYGGILGGDGNFVKIQPEWSSYQIIWPGWISATRFKAGWGHQYGDPRFTFVDEAQYLGGASTVRGFAENHLGPKDALGNPIGAEFIIVANQEFRWRTIPFFNPIPLIGGLFRRWPLYQSVFLDMGNGFQTESEIKLRNMAYSYGTGIQIMSPAGPIRLDYARVIPHDNFSFTDRWHFTILYAF